MCVLFVIVDERRFEVSRSRASNRYSKGIWVMELSSVKVKQMGQSIYARADTNDWS